MLRFRVVAFLLASTGLLAAQDNDSRLDALRLDQVQVIGTHNSYQMPADPRVMRIMGPRLKPLFAGMTQRMSPARQAQMAEEHPNPLADSVADALDYIQMPLEAQLRAGVRSLELDLQPDPTGGRFADPLPYRELRAAGVTDLAPIYERELKLPGMKVFHLADVDFRSQCPRFRQCLQLLRQWSDQNPGHTPVFILLEPKLDGLSRAVPGAAEVAPFNAASFDEVDHDIQDVIGRDHLVTPDDVRGTYATLEQAVLHHAWPTVAQARGKFLFLYIVPGMNLAAFSPYLQGHESLQGRAAFVQGQPGMPHTAFLLMDNATAHPGRVADAVGLGYLVRSRADIDTGEARRADATRRDATLQSGAQIISTDYPLGPNIYGNGYQVAPFPGGLRPDPVTTGHAADVK